VRIVKYECEFYMKISLENGGGIYRVHSAAPDCVAVVAAAAGQETVSRERASFLLAPDQLVSGWSPTSIEQVGVAELTLVLELNPELVLLGTGEQVVLPNPEFAQLFLSRGIGFESMQTAAACRTYNLLAYEGRRVVAALIVG